MDGQPETTEYRPDEVDRKSQESIGHSTIVDTVIDHWHRRNGFLAQYPAAQGIGPAQSELIVVTARPSTRANPLAELTKRLPIGASVLDVGCGNFQRIYRNLARRRRDIAVTGLEKYEDHSIYGPAPIYPPCTTERFCRLTCDVEHERFPFDDSTFDGAFLSHVIEHVDDSDRMLREICRTLKPGGLMYVETPGPKSLMRRPRWLPRAGDTINFYDDPTHIGAPYTFDRLRVELESAGFSVVAEAPFRQLGRLGAPVYLLMMAAGALPILPVEARVFAYGAGLRNLVGWAISVLAQKTTAARSHR